MTYGLARTKRQGRVNMLPYSAMCQLIRVIEAARVELERTGGGQLHIQNLHWALDVIAELCPPADEEQD